MRTFLRINDKVLQLKDYTMKEGTVSPRGNTGVVVGVFNDDLVEVYMQDRMLLTLPSHYFKLE